MTANGQCRTAKSRCSSAGVELAGEARLLDQAPRLIRPPTCRPPSSSGMPVIFCAWASRPRPPGQRVRTRRLTQRPGRFHRWTCRPVAQAVFAGSIRSWSMRAQAGRIRPRHSGPGSRERPPTGDARDSGRTRDALGASPGPNSRRVQRASGSAPLPARRPVAPAGRAGATSAGEGHRTGVRRAPGAHLRPDLPATRTVPSQLIWRGLIDQTHCSSAMRRAPCGP